LTIRAKLFWMVGITLGMLVLLGAALFQVVSQGRINRDRFIVIQDQFDSWGRLQLGAERYLRALLRARAAGEDTAPVLARFLETVDREEVNLEATSREELGEDSQHSRPGEWEETREALQALRRWATQLEARLRAQPPGDPTLSDEWELFDEFERDVGQLLADARAAELHEREMERISSEQGFLLGLRLTLFMPLAACVLLLGMVLLVLVPMRGALRELMTAARRIGEGNLHVGLSTQRKDELGMLSGAFNQMAQELRKVLDEKQRLIRAEAEANEREFRRYHAMLAAGVGHEINNPLSYVISNLHCLYKDLVRLQDCLPEEERAELLEILSAAREGAERVRVIVRDLKELSRPVENCTEPVKLDAVVATSAKLVSRQLCQRARLVMDCQGVPPVKGGMTRLGQVFLNLLINAAHAIPVGREEQNEVRVVARVRGPEQVEVEVSDTGSGIAPEHLSRIFEPFFTTKPVGEGTGLGLSVCHSIITSLGGELLVSSELGKGTTFRVLLPVAAEAAQPAQSQA
jgi:two-component system NtrC family sensor kinase